MFKQIAVLSTRTELSNRAEMKLPSSNVTIPEQLHGANFDQDSEPKTLAECAVSTAVGTVLQYAEVEYSSGKSLTKANLIPCELREPTPWYRRNDISTLDTTFPLNVSTPKLKGSVIQTSRGTSSRKVTGYGVETTADFPPTAVFLAPGTKEPLSPALDGMLSWNTSKTTAAPKREATDISLSRETFTQKALSSGSQWRSITDAEVVVPTAILHSNISVFGNNPVFSFGANLEPDIQIPEPTSPRKKAHRVTKSPNRSDFHITLASSMGMLEPAIIEPGSVTDNPKIERLKKIPPWCKGCEENSTVRDIAPSIQVEIVSPQNLSLERKNTFTKEVNPVVKQFAEIKSDESAKTQQVSLLPDTVEETDSSRSSSGEEGEQVPSFEDVTLVSSKPWVKRITARRRMRQGEFSKW